jgi:hypothetical protein
VSVLRDFKSSASSTHTGSDENVSTLSRNAGWQTSETRMPSAMATCIGVPDIEPETSAMHTSRKRPRGLLAPEDTVASASTSAATNSARPAHAAVQPRTASLTALA